MGKYRQVILVLNIKPKVLVVDDEMGVRRSIAVILRKTCDVIAVSSGEEALQKLKSEEIHLVLLDIRLPKMDGLKILREIKKTDENMMVIMITAIRDTKTAVEAMKLGAYDYITKPFDVLEIRALVERALEKRTLIKENLFLKMEIAQRDGYHEMIGNSEAISKIYSLIDRAAGSTSTVLISGESGTGKELTARAIHFKSSRAGKPFVVVNCAAIPENLLESELFGFERGAFTGAFERKEGKFEVADGGTIFLDEVCSMSTLLQAKMLRVLQSRPDGSYEIERIGSSKSIPIDVRVIAATNKNLKGEVEHGTFRQDLYYRLNVLPIEIPPLRNRKKDIPLLIDFFLNKFNRKLNKSIRGIAEDAVNFLVNYKWPGNVRELENLMERLVAIEDSSWISAEKLPVEVIFETDHASGQENMLEFSLKKAKEQLERQFIKKALREATGNRSKAAKILGLHRNTLFLKMEQLGLKHKEDEKRL